MKKAKKNAPPIDEVSDISLPELWCKIDQPVRVTTLQPMRPDSPVAQPVRKRPAALLRVLDHDDGFKKKDLAVTADLKRLLEWAYPKGKYVGHAFSITRHRRHERINAFGYSLQQINETK